MRLIEHRVKYLNYLLFVSIPFLMFSCYPGGMEYYSDTDVVITLHDEAFDFAGNKNYFMPDTIRHIVEEDEEDEVNRIYDDEVLARIAMHMESAGYTRFESDVIPDSVLVDSANVILAVVATSTEYSGVGYIPGGGYWWGWYPYGGYGGYGGGYSTSYYYPYYPYYPGYGWGYPYYYSYTTGTLFIEMGDEDGIDEVEEKIPIPWHAAVNGLLSGSLSDMQTRVDRSIDQCFEQSPYLFN